MKKLNYKKAVGINETTMAEIPSEIIQTEDKRLGPSQLLAPST